MKKMLTALLIMGTFALLAPACKKKPKDEDLKAAIEKVLAPGVTVAVADGVATLTGEVADEATKTAAEAAAKAVEGVKSVTNSLSVTPPPPPVEIAAEPALVQAVNTAVASFKGVTAEVKEGVVVLSGEIKKADMARLMAAVMALKPKSVDNSNLKTK